jgi:threonine dehydratase
MAAAYNWLKENSDQKTILILVSGGNIDPSLYHDLWNQDHLAKLPE